VNKGQAHKSNFFVSPFPIAIGTKGRQKSQKKTIIEKIITLDRSIQAGFRAGEI
jgi:hypothetical protein